MVIVDSNVYLLVFKFSVRGILFSCVGWFVLVR